MMMSRRLMACTAGAILCASFAFADGQKFAQLQPYLDGDSTRPAFASLQGAPDQWSGRAG
jgi:hypothetical protein